MDISIKKATAVLIVEAIEPCLAFWQARLGFDRAIEVPADGRLAFVALVKGSMELMLQTAASVREDSPAHAQIIDAGKTFLFVEVDDLDAVDGALAGFDVIMPRRETFYGSIETGYREPGGHCVTFAQFRR